MHPEMRPPVDLPAVPVTDVSWVVAAVAGDVNDFAVGDEVLGLLRFPSLDGSAYAQYVSASPHDLADDDDGALGDENAATGSGVDLP